MTVTTAVCVAAVVLAVGASSLRLTVTVPLTATFVCRDWFEVVSMTGVVKPSLENSCRYWSVAGTPDTRAQFAVLAPLIRMFSVMLPLLVAVKLAGEGKLSALLSSTTS